MHVLLQGYRCYCTDTGKHISAQPPPHLESVWALDPSTIGALCHHTAGLRDCSEEGAAKRAAGGLCNDTRCHLE